MEIITYDGKYSFVIDLTKVIYDKKWVNLYDDEIICKVERYTEDSAPSFILNNIRMKVGRTSKR